jgi:Ca2+:H+ antiporter
MGGIDQIKRQARKEAWYGDSYNPFRKTTRSHTWAAHPPVVTDPELGLGRGNDGSSPLSTVATEPIPESPRGTNHDASYDIRRGSKNEDYEMTKAGGSSSRPSDPDSEVTVVERPSNRPRSEEEKARHRFLGKWRKGNMKSKDPEEEKKPKKQPWYKGKDVPHQPFTVRNQLERTIFNSWINVLLVAAPVGIALNYVGVDGKIVFCVNFIAIIPLAGMLSFATEEIALHLGESLGGLLNASFGLVMESARV